MVAVGGGGGWEPRFGVMDGDRDISGTAAEAVGEWDIVDAE